MYAAFRAGLEDYGTGVYDFDHPDELEVLGGRKSVINKKSNANSPAKPTAGSPSTLYEGKSTPDSHGGSGDTRMGHYELPESPGIIRNGSRNYEMDEAPARVEHHPFLPTTKPQGEISSPINHYRTNHHPAPVASGSLPSGSSPGYHSTGKSSGVWQVQYSYPPHSNQGRTSNPPGLSLPYINLPQFQAGATSFGLPASQEPNQDEIWGNFLLEFGGEGRSHVQR